MTRWGGSVGLTSWSRGSSSSLQIPLQSTFCPAQFKTYPPSLLHYFIRVILRSLMTCCWFCGLLWVFGLKGVPIRINIYNSWNNSAVAVGGEHGTCWKWWQRWIWMKRRRMSTCGLWIYVVNTSISTWIEWKQQLSPHHDYQDREYCCQPDTFHSAWTSVIRIGVQKNRRVHTRDRKWKGCRRVVEGMNRRILLIELGLKLS